MKKTLFRLSLVLATIVLAFASCSKEDEYDEDLLVGSWSTSSWSYFFDEDHTGYRIQGKVKQEFEWTLDGDELELKIGGYDEGQSEIVTFTVYIIEELTETKMEAYDKADSSKTKIIFTKKK